MMRSATAFLPLSMITFMNLDNSTLPNLGSGRISRLGTSRQQGIFSPHFLQLASLQPPRGSCKPPTYSTRARHLRFRVTTLQRRATRQAAPKYLQRSLGLGLFGAVLGARL